MGGQQPDPDDYHYTIVSITGSRRGNLHLLGNSSPRVSDPNDISSFVQHLHVTDESTETKSMHELALWATDMDETAKGTLVGVSIEGILFMHRAGRWSTQDLKCPEGIQGIWAAGDDEFFACGLSGERIHIVGKHIDESPEEERRPLFGVHGSSPKHVLMVGESGAVFRFDGKKWRESEAPTNKTLMCVSARSEKESYIAGAKGALFRSDGDDWEPIKAPNVTFHSLAWYQDKLFLAAGVEGVFALVKDGPELIKKFSQPIYRLRTIEKHLFAYGGDLLVYFDGKDWTGGTMAG